jgi:uncharacterized protein (DUF952 family)
VTIIYHITTREAWQAAQKAGHYTAESLESEGFIHCSKATQAVEVANAFYRDVQNLVLLCIESDKLVAELKWEAPAHPEIHEPPPQLQENLFPHVYGTINLNAVVRVVDFPQGVDGFSLPDGL